MKVLHIINSLATGGAEKLILETLPRYNALGIKADVLLLNGTSHPFLEALKKQNCCEIFILGKSSPYQLKFILKIIPYLKKYDLIHAHLFPATYFSIIAKKLSLSKTPVIFTEHNTSNKRFRSKKLKKINRWVYSFFDCIVCITDEVKQEVIAQTSLPEEKLVVINNGVDVSKFSQAEAQDRTLIDHSLQKNDFLLCQVSSFRAQKDQKTVIKALQYLPENVKLILVGEGSLRESAENLVKELNLENRVCFVGNRTDIPQILKTANVNILSSNYEGLSLSSIEGMSAGRPFIASDVPGLSDVVRHAGILFPKGDEKKLAEEIHHLMEDENYYQSIVEKCLKRAAQFDINIMVEKHVLFYQKMLASKESIKT
ncbi:Glycosyltransferase involved in cell wall bisynthesis [Halpernia humi]|uniref:Glycosyltransferase involved in cell wall bisynthesis n=1 Tax=Halpernia humi TaxID=493375 RepID=A0A1H6APF8_9FLAO|nr:glycosyltransferase [Halpernia humi]SEG50411.1 Glycosyltransferase involved in cell wall bisynthesis [Halpernia humi]